MPEDKNINNALLTVRDLKTHFYSMGKTYRAVDGVSFDIKKGKTLGMVGESGCGKSVTALSILRLIQSPPGKIISGSIFFKDKDILRMNQKEVEAVRGNQISMIFQEPMTSLNPVFTIGEQIGEVFRLHKKMPKSESIKEAVKMLEVVKIPDAKERVRDYPHQLSGGMRQRVMIAMALACNPDLLIADEPTTALDVTVQAQILDLMQKLKDEYDSSILMITHDLGVIAEVADEVAVMYAGMIVEFAQVKDFFKNPMHPYTISLLKSRPRLEDIKSENRLYSIPGSVPDPSDYPQGCRFYPRCYKKTERCLTYIPELTENESGHFARCINI